MQKPLEILRPAPLKLASPSELAAHMKQVLSGNLPGFVVRAAMPDAFKQSIKEAANMGLSGGVNSTSMTFDYDASVIGLAEAHAQGHMPGPEEWDKYGITSLHADGEEGDEMLSISLATAGAYTINILKRGPARTNDMPIELWDSLQQENTRLLLDGKVDTENLMPAMTSLDVTVGDTVIFNPSQPHMGITTQAPRLAETTFFYKV